MPLLPGSPAKGSIVGHTHIAGVGGVDSNYLIQCIPCIKGFNHPDLPAIMVLMEYIGTLEVCVMGRVTGGLY